MSGAHFRFFFHLTFFTGGYPASIKADSFSPPGDGDTNTCDTTCNRVHAILYLYEHVMPVPYKAQHAVARSLAVERKGPMGPSIDGGPIAPGPRVKKTPMNYKVPWAHGAHGPPHKYWGPWALFSSPRGSMRSDRPSGSSYPQVLQKLFHVP